MIMGWFLPLGFLIGAAGTQTAFKSRRHHAKARTRDRLWWLLVILAWLPTVCWILAQFVEQY